MKLVTIKANMRMDCLATDFSNIWNTIQARRIYNMGMQATIYCRSGIECNVAVMSTDMEQSDKRET